MSNGDEIDTSHMSQNVFFEADEEGKIHLSQGDHAGSHFFKSLAELNRTKFVQQENEASGDRVALSMVHTIWNKGQGKIFLLNGETNQWKEVRKIGEAQSLVFRALENLFDVQRHNSFPTRLLTIPYIKREQPSELNAHETTLNNQNEEQGDSTQRRHSATTLEAASSLLLVQEAAAELEQEENEQLAGNHEEMNDIERQVTDKEQMDEQQEEEETNVQGNDEQQEDEQMAEQQAETQEQTEEEQPIEQDGEEKTDLQVKFENTNVAMVASFESNNSSLSPSSSPELDHAKDSSPTAKPPKKPERRRRSACPSTDYVADRPGIEFASVDSTDVLCGGSGEGVLAIRHEGNKRFLKVIEAGMEDFHKSDDRGKLRIAQQTVENNVPRGRFLAYNPETGLWHELKRDKAWFKSLRTFLKRQHRHAETSASNPDRKQRARPLPLRRAS